MEKRAVLYARVSSDDTGKNDRNFGTVNRPCAGNMPFPMVMKLWSNFGRMIGERQALRLNWSSLVKSLTWHITMSLDVLVVREIDRLSRNLAKQLVIEETLTRHGVQIDYVIGSYENNPEGNFMKHVRATVAEYEREKIKERMVRGKGLMVHAGSVMPHGKAGLWLSCCRRTFKNNGDWRFTSLKPKLFG